MYWRLGQSAPPLHLLLLTILQSADALRNIASKCGNVSTKMNYSGLHLKGIQKFMDYECTKSLDLSNNELQQFSIDSHVIKHLDLRNNSLRSIQMWAPNLETLYLDDNYLTELINLYLPKLKVLSLRGNPAKRISIGIFDVMSRMQIRERHHLAMKINERTIECVSISDNIVRIDQSTCLCFVNNRLDFLKAQFCDAQIISNSLTFQHTEREGSRLRSRNLRLLRSIRSVTEEPVEGSSQSPYKSDLTMPYNPMTGIYTAGTLSGMLVMFLLCMVYYKIKKETKKIYKKWRDRRTLRVKARMSSIEVGSAISHQEVMAIPQSDKSSSRCTVQLTQIRKLDETRI